MNKVIQIANICKGMCNTANPIPGRIYYPKGCSPALNTCGGGWRIPMYLWLEPKQDSVMHSDARITAARMSNMERASFTSTIISAPLLRCRCQTDDNG